MIITTTNLQNTWVTNGERVARVKDANLPDSIDPSGTLDLVFYTRDGAKVGRVSPAMGGPKEFEPCCSASFWRSIYPPVFPLPRHGDIESKLRYWDALPSSQP